MDAAIPPWGSDRCWEGLRQQPGARLSAGPRAEPRVMHKPRAALEANPWEGALGPPVIEAGMAVSAHKRGDILKELKTPKEVWAKGKPATQFAGGALPGAHMERAAAERTPAHMRGNSKAARGVLGCGERVPDPISIKTTKRVWKTEEQKLPDGTSGGIATIMTIRPKCREPERMRARSAAAVLEDAGSGASTRRLPDNEEDAGAWLRDLKAQLSRLEQTAKDKEAELERLKSASGKSDRDAAHVGEAEENLEDFKRRVEARQRDVEDRLPDLSKQKSALEEIIKRLHKANKHMNNRLGQCREELRQFNGEIRDMNLLLKDVESARNEALSEVERMKTESKEDSKKRNLDLARKQSRVEKMLAETKERAERLKEAQTLEKETQMERQAEEDLARKRAFDNGTDFGTELRRIRENVHGPLTPEDPAVPQEQEEKLETAMKKIMQAAHASDVQGVLAFWRKTHERKSSLESLSQELATRVERLSLQAENLQNSGALDDARPTELGAAGQGRNTAEKRDLEDAVRDIESFADQNVAVNEAMRGVLRKYISWASSVYSNMVRVAHMVDDDDTFLRVSHRLSRKIPGKRDEIKSDYEDRLANWCSDSFVSLQDALLAKMHEVDRAQRRMQSAGGPPSGPEVGPRITALSSNQTMLVSRNKASTQMERL